ncbi:NADP-dependent oxidoreductase [Solimonas variicoloris]|uniref:NADP-dependent oxidoreductase n=1 Tax=Solimonas variicoloris TaxID=254408 RepID=UPI000382679C|nr:NADP-dependent oxidoreductase [Solimonas variicoloris]
MGAALNKDTFAVRRMQAVRLARYGEPEVLAVDALERPRPGAGQLRVRVHAAAVQPVDAQLRAGRLAGRLAPLPLRLPLQLGNAFAGTVDALGDGADEFEVGDAVLGWALLSCYAEYVVVSPAQIVGKPPAMPWDVAAVLPGAPLAAQAALRALNVGRGETVLIHDAANDTGAAAVQLARRHGATVIGTAARAQHDRLRRLGAQPLDAGAGLAAALHALAVPLDAALDARPEAAGDDALAALLAHGIESGRIGTLADAEAAQAHGVRHLRPRRSLAALDELVDLHAAGVLRVAVRHRYGLHEAAAAHRLIEQSADGGAVVLIVADD